MQAFAAWRRRHAGAEDGFTLIELLVVGVVLTIILAGLTQLFTSGVSSEIDQRNRVMAQQDVRVALDKFRREVHCGSGVASPFSATSLTIYLPGYCPSTTATTLSADTAVTSPGPFNVSVASTVGFSQNTNNEITIVGSLTPIDCTSTTATSFTGCTGGTPNTYPQGTPVGSSITWCVRGSSAPYTLVRYVGGAAIAGASCSNSGGATVIPSLKSSSIFAYTRSSLVGNVSGSGCSDSSGGTTAICATAASGGSLDPGVYYYDVTAVTSAGEYSGTISTTPCSIAASSGNYTCHITWHAFTPPSGTLTRYNVYGRDIGTTPPRVSGTAETPQGLRLIGTTTSTSFDDTNACDTASPFSGCPQNPPPRPPLGTVNLTVSVIQQKKQSYTLTDGIVLRNSGRY
jgi:prepilin-type N-terminal cleavage/methylation domain-containing protein